MYRKPDIKVKSVVLADPNNPFTLTLPGQNPDNPGLSLGMLLNMTISVASDNAYSLTISNISLTVSLKFIFFPFSSSQSNICKI